MLHLLLPAALALASAAAGATPPQADEAGAAVPETRYRAPHTYRPADKPATTPDRHWIEANRSVLGYNPMMLTMPERRPAPQAEAVQPAPRAPTHEHGAHGHAVHAGHDKKEQP